MAHPIQPLRPSRSDQLTTFFRNPEYISAAGGRLNQFNVLLYFATSEFWERGCTNAALQMQSGQPVPQPWMWGTNNGSGGSAGTGNPTSAATTNGPSDGYNKDPVVAAWERRNEPHVLEQELRRFTGVEFVVAHAKPPDLFVIHKRWRTSPTVTQVLDVYYILHGNITMAADLFAVLGSRFLSTVSALQQSLDVARQAQPRFNPREGHAWRIAAEEQPEEEEEGEGEEKGKPLTEAQVDVGTSQIPG